MTTAAEIRRELLHARATVVAARRQLREALAAADEAEQAMREWLIKPRLRVMVSPKGQARHLSRILPDGSALALCGLPVDPARTARVEHYWGGTIRRPDCEVCAAVLLRNGREARR